MANIWSDIQLLLHAQLNSGHYKVWIAPLQAELQILSNAVHSNNTVKPSPQGLSDDSGVNLNEELAPCHTLKLYAPTNFVATRVKERYWSAIISAANTVCGENINLELKVGRAVNPLTAAEIVEPSSTNSTQDIGANSVYQENINQNLNETQNHYQSNCNTLNPAAQMGLPLNYPLPLAKLSCITKTERETTLPTKYSFDSFVVGPCNELAFAAARTLCNEALHNDVNTLFLNSGPGLGKTHLMQAMGHCIKQHDHASPLRVACLTAEEFGSRMIAAIRAKETDRFKTLYRSVDVLLLEDIQFLQGKEKMQEEVLSTIKYIRDRGGRVVFSSSFAPHELKDLDSQLASRFASGFLAVLEQPCFETRKILFSQKAKLQHIILPDPITEFLAEHVKSDIRKIESCLHNLILHARLLNREISMDLAMNVLKQFAEQNQIIDLDSIVRTVCRAFGIHPDDIVSKSRRANLVSARNSIFYLARKHTSLTLAEIGHAFNRTHTSVIKGISSLEREISRQSPLGMQLNRTIELIERNSRA